MQGVGLLIQPMWPFNDRLFTMIRWRPALAATSRAVGRLSAHFALELSFYFYLFAIDQFVRFAGSLASTNAVIARANSTKFVVWRMSADDMHVRLSSFRRKVFWMRKNVAFQSLSTAIVVFSFPFQIRYIYITRRCLKRCLLKRRSDLYELHKSEFFVWLAAKTKQCDIKNKQRRTGSNKKG